MFRGIALALPVLLATLAPAHAQRAVTEVTRVSGTMGDSAATKVTQSPILRTRRLELGGELAFLTADRDLLGRELAFSDVVLMPLHVRMAVAKWLELSGGTSLLIKQSEAMDEPVWQGANLSLRVPFGAHFASSLNGAGGALMFDRGHYWGMESSLLTRLEANRWLRFELRAGYALTSLRYEVGSSTLHELMTHAEIQFRESFGGGWLGVDYYVPLASTSSGAAFDPNTRINLQVGYVLTPRDTGWDLYLSYGIVDRGSVDRPETTLPILNGGFDQRQIVLGVQHRIDLGAAKPKHGEVVDY